MKKKIVLMAMVLVIVLSFGAGVGFADGKVYKMKMATVVTPPHPYISASEYFIDRVQQLTEGKVQISFHPSSSLGSDQNTIDEMRMGTVDFVVGGVSPFTPFVPEFSVFSIPYLFSGYDMFHRAMSNDGVLFKHFVKIMDERKLDLKLLAICGGGVRNVSNNLKPVVKPTDMAGMKMRVPNDPLKSKTWKTTGALPSPMAWKEIYSAMQTGVVNAFESSISGYYGSKYYEVAPYHTMTQHQFMVSHITMSQRTFDKLPEEYQKIILQVGAEAGRMVTNVGREFDDTKLKELIEKYGVKVNDVDIQAWLNLFMPLQDDMAAGLKGSKEGPKILSEIRSCK